MYVIINYTGNFIHSPNLNSKGERSIFFDDQSILLYKTYILKDYNITQTDDEFLKFLSENILIDFQHSVISELMNQIINLSLYDSDKLYRFFNMNDREMINKAMILLREETIDKILE